MHLKVFLKLKKNLKALSSGQIYKKNKKPQKTHWACLKKNPGFFPTLPRGAAGGGPAVGSPGSQTPPPHAAVGGHVLPKHNFYWEGGGGVVNPDPELDPHSFWAHWIRIRVLRTRIRIQGQGN
jgi:hypothetical protein